MILHATITFDGWLVAEVSVPDNFDRANDPIPDEAVEAALGGSWDDFGVLQVHDVTLND